MPNTPSITTVKRFLYRGLQEEWSNTYHFAGAAPMTDAGWLSLADALIAREKLVLPTTHQFVRAYGYAAGNEHSVAQIDYVATGNSLVNGTIDASAKNVAPGDSAFMIRAKVGTSSKGKKVYIRKYFHGATYSQPTPDSVDTPQRTAATTLATTLVGSSGPLPGGWCAPQGAAGTDAQCLPYITTRTLKRRGKRP